MFIGRSVFPVFVVVEGVVLNILACTFIRQETLIGDIDYDVVMNRRSDSHHGND